MSDEFAERLPLPRAVVAELGWICGSWRGTVPAFASQCSTPGPVEHSWELSFLVPSGGFLGGVWRNDSSISLIALRDVDGTIEWRMRTFTALLASKPGDPDLTLRLVSIGARSAVFESIDELGAGHPAALRFELSREEAGALGLSFLIPDAAGGWRIARREMLTRG